MPKMPKTSEIFCCEICHFECNKKSNYLVHIGTAKHRNRTILNGLEQPINTKVELDENNSKPQYMCKNCKKLYKVRNSLWYHEKVCKTKLEPTHDKTSNPSDKELVMMLIKQNTQLIELIKNGTHNINSNNVMNSNNKSFNLNFFLNETCKDAMNIMDFVDSIKLQLSDLENVGKVGFVNGISNLIVKNLKALDETQRPVHCTDKKREVIYVKDEDKWEKEDAEYKKVRKAIKTIAKKNSKLLFEFKEKHPDCIEGDSKHSDKYSKLLIEAYGGANKEDDDNENKIIKNISKEVVINR
jgi:hypothetical protein